MIALARSVTIRQPKELAIIIQGRRMKRKPVEQRVTVVVGAASQIGNETTAARLVRP